MTRPQVISYHPETPRTAGGPEAARQAEGATKWPPPIPRRCAGTECIGYASERTERNGTLILFVSQTAATVWKVKHCVGGVAAPALFQQLSVLLPLAK